MAKAPTSDQYGEIVCGPGTTNPDETPITIAEQRAHMYRVEVMTTVLRDVLLAMADIPPFNMMVSAEQKAQLKAL